MFAKIFLWLLVATLLTTGAMIVASVFTLTARERNSPFAIITEMQLRLARHAYESGGAAELKASMERALEGSGMKWRLLDARGIDLATGEDRSALLERVKRRRLLPPLEGRYLVLDRPDKSGDYWFLLLIPRRRWSVLLFRRQFLLVIGIAFLLCYPLARHLTAPVRQLQRAVERFGAGELDTRIATDRADELGRLARTFNQMADRIQRLRAAERRLLQDISHELRSPLARLSVAAELARTNEHRESALNQIEKESERMNQLVGELLSVTRAEGDPGSLKLERTDLSEIAASVVADGNVEAEARDCSIEINAPGAVVVNGDAELLRRAVDNVVRNAVRHAPPGSKIEVSLERAASTAVLSVRDFGPGVPAEALPRLFDPFYRVEADRSRERGGAGLGLSIARRAVELHRGSIKARNASPGLRVELELPVAEPHSV